jgi:glycosyltransferase involved in cell wall biosynthesis
MRLGILTSHPIQYHAPWFRALAKETDLQVFFAHRQSPAEQGKAGFGVAFDWDVDLLSGYRHTFLPNVARAPSVNHFFGCDTPQITAEIASGKFDAFIVTGWFLKAYWQAVRACQRNNIPVLVRGDSHLHTPRSLPRKWVKKIAYRIMLKRFDGFLAVGQRNREYLSYYGVPTEKIFCAPHFVNNEWFAARAKEEPQGRRALRGSWGASDQTLVLLFVGKFRPLKRPADLLRALKFSQERSVDTVAVFVGSGELDQALRTEAKQLGVRAHFVGFKNQSELPCYYAAADALVLPSESETWGLVVNEAMACGVPAIVSDAVGCAPDLIEEGKTGFIFSVGDCGQLARQVKTLAELKERGHDFRPVLASKLRDYSVEAAVRGTLKAIGALARQRAEKQ